jgi:hypothetical protein
LDWLDDQCAVVGCHGRVSIEHHHTEPYRRTGHTRLSDLAPLCRLHHRLVERDHYQLHKRADGEYDLIAPAHTQPPREHAPP